MESERDLEEQLRVAERGEAASWLSWSAPSRWTPPFFALWAAAFALNVALDEDGPGSVVVNLTLSAAAVAFLWVTRRSRGSVPQGRAPRELRAAVTWSMVAFVGVLIIGWALAFSIGAWAALGSAVAAYVALTIYERSYAKAAERLRDRVGGGS